MIHDWKQGSQKQRKRQPTTPTNKHHSGLNISFQIKLKTSVPLQPTWASLVVEMEGAAGSA
jgi:hypothetical protein